MRYITQIHKIGIAALLAIVLINSTYVQAQNEEPEGSDEEKLISLNPFEIVEESHKSYGATTLTSATRLNANLIDIPQQISVLTEKLLRDVGAIENQDVFAYAAGVQSRGGSVFSNFFRIRGFSQATTYKNNMRISGGSNINFTQDFGNIQRVEIIKGPAGAIAGTGAVGGLVNYITKKPVFDETFFEGRMTVGSDSLLRFDMDYNVPLGEKTSARLVASNTRSEHFRDIEDIERNAIFPSVRTKLNDKITLFAEAEFISGQFPSNMGQMFDSFNLEFLPINYTISEVGALRDDDQIGFWLGGDFVANEHITYRQRFYRGEVDYVNNWIWALEIKQAAAGDPFFDEGRFLDGETYFTRQLREFAGHDEVIQLQGDLVLRYDFANGNITNESLVAWEYVKEDSDFKLTFFDMEPIGTINPRHGLPISPIASLIVNNNTEREFRSVWLSHRTTLWDRLSIWYGIRRDTRDGDVTTNFNPDGSVLNVNKDDESTVSHQKIGATLKLFKNFSLYGVFAENEQPSTSVLKFPAAPEDHPENFRITVTPTGELKEVGLKGEFFNQALTVTLAVFELSDSGRSLSTGFGPSNTLPNFFTELGGLETLVLPGDTNRGFELEFFGSIFTPKLSLSGSFTHYETESIRGVLSDGSQDIKEFRGVPGNGIRLLLNYDFRSSRNVDGLEARIGYLWNDEQQGVFDNSFQFGSATNVDIGFTYHMSDWTLQLNIKNIFNEIFPTEPNGFRFVSILPARQARFSVSRRW